MGSDLTLYHNPRCSKSREAKQILDSADRPYDTVLYLENPPDRATLAALARAVDDPRQLVRAKEAREAGWSDTDGADADAVARFLAEHPCALQRPVVVRGDRVVIGRPPERVRELL